MPRVAPTLYEFVELDDGEYLKVAEAVFRDLRPPGLAAHEPRPRAHQGARRQGRHRRVARDGRRGAPGRLGQRARLRRRGRCAWTSTRPTTRPPSRPTCGVAQRRPQRVRRASSRRTSPRQRQEGFSAVQVKVPRGDLTPEQLRGARPTSRARTPAATCARPCTRTCSSAGCATRRSTTCGRALASSASATPASTRSATSSRARAPTRASSGITSSMGLNLAVREKLAEIDDHRPAHAQDPHQDERLPERLQPAPHREHRVLRRVDQGRRAHDARPTWRTSAATSTAARSSTASA